MNCHMHGLLSFYYSKDSGTCKFSWITSISHGTFPRMKKQIKYSSSLHNISCKQQLDSPGHWITFNPLATQTTLQIVNTFTSPTWNRAWHYLYIQNYDNKLTKNVWNVFFYRRIGYIPILQGVPWKFFKEVQNVIYLYIYPCVTIHCVRLVKMSYWTGNIANHI